MGVPCIHDEENKTAFFNPDYAKELHNPPERLTKIIQTGFCVSVNPDRADCSMEESGFKVNEMISCNRIRSILVY